MGRTNEAQTAVRKSPQRWASPAYAGRLTATLGGSPLWKENEKATRCFQLAKIAHSKGHHVDLFFIDGGVMWANQNRDLNIKTSTGDCPADHLPYLVDNEVAIGICTPCAKNRGLDEARFFSNMLLDGGPHLIDMAAEAKVFNF